MSVSSVNTFIATNPVGDVGIDNKNGLICQETSKDTVDLLSSLPPEMKVKIMMYLDLAELGRLACVDNAFRTLVKEFFDGNVEKLNLAEMIQRYAIKLIKNKKMYELAPNCLRYLRALDLSKFDNLNDEYLSNVCTKANKLVKLKVNDYGEIKNRLITSTSLRKIGNLVNLEELDLTFCKSITNDDLDYINNRNLKIVNISDCEKITNLEFLGKLNKIEALYITYLKGPAIQSLKNCANKLVNLKILDLKQCELTNEDIKVLTGILKNLEVLNLKGTAIQDPCLEDIAKLNQLKQLSLARCHVTDVGVEFLKNKLLNLEELCVGDCEELTDNALDVFSTFTKLRNISLYYCEKITDVGLKKLQNLTKLEVVDLISCILITNQGLKEFKEKLPMLRKLTTDEEFKFH